MNLFAYGTLMWPQVLEAVTGRRVTGSPAVLDGYKRLRVIGQPYPVVLVSENDAVDGVLYQNLSAAEFAALDAFEGEEYDRCNVVIGDTETFVYVLNDQFRHLVDPAPWRPEDFTAEALASFCEEYKGWKQV